MKKFWGIVLVLVFVLVLSACNANHDSQQEGTASHSHSYGKWTVKAEATCNTNGTQSRVCEECGFTETQQMDMLPHTEVIDATVPASCTSEGLTEGKHCSVCNTVIVKQETIPVSHTYQQTATTTATCIEEGTTTYTCSLCNDVKVEKTSKTAHSYNEGEITTAAICTSQGIKTYTCKVCSTTKTETISKLGHNPNSNNICTRCGEVCPIELNMTSSEKTNANKVYYISQRQIWYEEDEKCHVLVFSLLDSSENELSTPAVVEIKIVNDKNEEVYSAVKVVKSSDFGTWSYNNGAVKKYQASIKIYDNEIKGGKVDTGDIYFTVYNTGYFSFDESTLSVNDLPVMPTTIILPTLPETIHDYTYSGKTDSSVKITNITYEISGDDLYIYFTGEKTHDAEGNKYSQSCKVGWKLYDSEGYIVDSGTFYSPNIAVGEKFRNEKEYAWDVIEPGETYTLVISNVD